MSLTQRHLDAVWGLADFYIPSSGSGTGDAGGEKTNGDDAHPMGCEQIRITDQDTPPRVTTNNESGFPRLQKFYEYNQLLNYVDWPGHESRRFSQFISQRRTEYSQTHDFQEAMRLARFGWVEGLKKISHLEPIKLPITEALRQSYDAQTQYDIAGGAVNIGKYLAGEPNCMRRMQIPSGHNIPSRIQKIIIIQNSHCETPANSILKYGYMAYQIIDALEMANIKTEITLARSVNKLSMHYETDYDFYEVYIKLKNAGDRISPEKLLFALAHPSFYRRIVISENERNPRWLRKKFGFFMSMGISAGYGAYIAEWQPPESMARDAIIIKIPDTKKHFESLMCQTENLIKSQYEKVR